MAIIEFTPDFPSRIAKQINNALWQYKIKFQPLGVLDKCGAFNLAYASGGFKSFDREEDLINIHITPFCVEFVAAMHSAGLDRTSVVRVAGPPLDDTFTGYQKTIHPFGTRFAARNYTFKMEMYWGTAQGNEAEHLVRSGSSNLYVGAF